VYAQAAPSEKAPKSDARPVKSDQSRREELTKMLEQRKNELKQNNNSSEGRKRESREEPRKENNREGRKD